jgi:CDP-glucose 4,6-dehydratase
MLDFEQILGGRTILLTGHTGFTGSWLSLWLSHLGCRIVGISLPPATSPNLHDSARISECVEAHLFDIADAGRVQRVMAECKPDIVLHLAAQPLVSQSFADPVETFRTNIMGTVHVLEAARQTRSVKAAVCVTTDKVYADKGLSRGFRESDPLGGKDPYSASKAGAEMVIASYAQTLAARGNNLHVAAARGGNIIGGGDWSANRIVPDFVRAVTADQPLVLRNPESTRPWQHVLALCHGYLVLAAALLREAGEPTTHAWNFGPAEDGNRTVRDLVVGLGEAWRPATIRLEPGSFPETRLLQLDSSLARKELGWKPPLTFDDTVALTAAWYRSCAADPALARDVTLAQIESFRQRLTDHA